MAAGFPNLFMITGPGSPSVLSNMMVSIEQHVDWIADCLDDLRAEGSTTIEPTRAAVAGWVQHVNDYADITLMPQANSWYMGANVPGQAAGVPAVRRRRRPLPHRRATRSSASDYLGFERRRADGNPRNDGVIRRVQPDVAIMLELMAEPGPAAAETTVAGRRAGVLPRRWPRAAAARAGGRRDRRRRAARRRRRPRLPALPPGDDRVRTRSSSTSTAAAGCSAATTSDDPFCRDLCVRIRRHHRVGRTTATRRRHASRPRPTTRSPPCGGSPTNAA